MNIVNFEGLGFSFNINKVFLDLGFAKIYWYAFLIIIAIIIVIIFCKKDDGKYSIRFDNILELSLFLLPISVICARLYFVIFKLDYYSKNVLEIFNITDGGLAIYGGIIGGIITTYLYCKFKKIKFIDMCDYIIPFLPLAQAIGRWGNFFNIEAHGTETMNIFRMGIIENGNYIQVHPTFLYESFFNIIIFIILYIIRKKRKFQGQLTYLYFILYGTVRAIIEPLRTDSLKIGEYRISQVLSIILVFSFTIIFIKSLSKTITKK